MPCWQGESEGSIVETATKCAEEQQQQQTPSHGRQIMGRVFHVWGWGSVSTHAHYGTPAA